MQPLLPTSKRIKDHLGVVDLLYASLLKDEDKNVNNVAKLFMSGEQEIKKIVAQYVKKWCNRTKHELVIYGYDKFLEDTEEIFEIVLSRIQDETDKRYPPV